MTTRKPLVIINGIMQELPLGDDTGVAYETGLFTPTLYGSTLAGTCNFTVCMGRYTRIGNRIFFHIKLQWDTHTGTGNFRIGALPFVAQAALHNTTACSAVLSSSVVFDGTLVPLVMNNTNVIVLRCSKTGVGFVDIPLTATGLMLFDGVYEI